MSDIECHLLQFSAKENLIQLFGKKFKNKAFYTNSRILNL
ncbi:hypothetical protein CSS_0124 [Campylobacter jejuni subsp. jejuni 305]|nr:hypothetical protein CSS_0124 [Campylobacter jejuni subsp. jejuni 305]